MKPEPLLTRKAIAINDDEGRITTLESLVARARAQVKNILRSTHFRILPTVTYDPQSHSYIFLVEYLTRNVQSESFEVTMSKLQRRS